MKDCVKCARPVDGDTCIYCKWSESKNAYAQPDEDARRVHLSCAHEIRGQRCANAGVVSASTLGGDSFFCWQHAPMFRTFKNGTECAPPMGWAKLKAQIRPFDFEGMLERKAMQDG